MMRKLSSKKDGKQKQKRNQLLIGGLLILVMMASTFGILSNSFGKNAGSETEINYKGQEFQFANNLWYTSIGNLQFAIKTNPLNILEISEQVNYLNSYSGKPLYVYSENYESKMEVYRNFYSIAERMQDACPDLGNSSVDVGKLSCENEWPLKNCENNLIIIKKGEEEKIIQEDNCLIIVGKNENLMMLTDGAILKIIGVQ